MNKIVDETSSAKTEEITICPLCEAAESEHLFWNFDRLHFRPGKFGLLRCTICDLYRLSPRPTEDCLVSYYPSDEYYSYRPPDDLSVLEQNTSPTVLGILKRRMRDCVLQSYGYPVPSLRSWQKLAQPALTRFFKNRALYGLQDVFPRYVPGGRALDIGCGNAEVLAYLKHFGWKVDGVDFSPAAAISAKKYFDIDVFVGKIEDARFEPESFDFIRMSHVIEHLPSVVDSMKYISSLLKPGGSIYIETPNIDAFSFRHAREYWYPLECPRHLFLFSPKTLTDILRACRISATKVETFFYDTYHWERTYREEQETVEIAEPRPMTDRNLRENILKLKSRAEHLFDPMNGDILRAWAVKE